MKLALEAIKFFEKLATNAHHQIPIEELIAQQSPEIKEIFLSKSSEVLRKQFSITGYFADSIKVTEI